MKQLVIGILVFVLSIFVNGCGDDDDGSGTNSDADTDVDTDTDSDTDTNTDSDSDSDTDSDTDTDSDADSDYDTGTDSYPDVLWITIDGGIYEMGSNSGQADEVPIHEVIISVFEMTKTEITVSQYGECVADKSCTELETSDGCNWNEDGFENHPVNCVNWSEAVQFCDWLHARLPSESEWEYASRSLGQVTTYPWGESSATCDYAIMDDFSDGGDYGCGTFRTWPVCSKTDGNTEQELCDMTGNVWEWMQDWYHASYDGAPGDGTAWENPSGDKRVLRGASWFDSYPGDLTTTNRFKVPPADRYINAGFRCTRDEK